MRTAILAFACTLLAGVAHAEIKTQTIEYTHAGATYVGILAYDDAVATEKTPRPGVVICPEWWGNGDYTRGRAQQLAEQGYVAFAIDMYGKGEGAKASYTNDPQQAAKWAGEVMKDVKVLRERAMAGYKTLTAQKMVDAKHVAAIGYCMGGTTALELARAGAPLDAVVAFHASVVSAREPADNKNIKGTVLVCHGQDDTFVQPGELDKFHAQMKEAGVDYELDVYADTVHSFTNKGADAHNMPGVKYNEKADKRSWARTLALFAEKFGATRPATGGTSAR